ncbi:glycosyltransferase family 2 protein [Arthrobacter sp. TMN-37]
MDAGLAVVVPVFNEPSIGRTLEGLYRQHHRAGVHTYVVDNGSTDGTRARIAEFLAGRGDFPLTVLTEPAKGTGAACDTGFRRAIEDGFPLIARTDGDSVPRPDWTGRILGNFGARPGLALLGGTSVPLDDAYRRAGDRLFIPTAFFVLRASLAAGHLDRNYLRLVVGHNLATRAAAYERVGGFPRTSITERDEDIEYTLRVARGLGRGAVHIDPDLVVATSMRRIRAYGAAGAALHHLLPGLRGRLGRDADVR